MDEAIRPEIALAREIELHVIGLEALRLGERDHLGLAQHLDADDILAAEFLALDDPVIDRPVGLAQILRKTHRPV